jgi:hypothetical protein
MCELIVWLADPAKPVLALLLGPADRTHQLKRLGGAVQNLAELHFPHAPWSFQER